MTVTLLTLVAICLTSILVTAAVLAPALEEAVSDCRNSSREG